MQEVALGEDCGARARWRLGSGRRRRRRSCKSEQGKVGSSRALITREAVAVRWAGGSCRSGHVKVDLRM